MDVRSEPRSFEAGRRDFGLGRQSCHWWDEPATSRNPNRVPATVPSEDGQFDTPPSRQWPPARILRSLGTGRASATRTTWFHLKEKMLRAHPAPPGHRPMAPATLPPGSCSSSACCALPASETTARPAAKGPQECWALSSRWVSKF